MKNMKIPKFAKDVGIVRGIACGPKNATEAKRMLKIAVKHIKRADKEEEQSRQKV